MAEIMLRITRLCFETVCSYKPPGVSRRTSRLQFIYNAQGGGEHNTHIVCYRRNSELFASVGRRTS